MNCRWINVPQINDERGTLLFLEAERQVPFPIRRMYALVGVPKGTARGGHAHIALEQCFLAVTGSITMSLSDGRRREEFRLEGCSKMLYVGPMLWRDLTEFSDGAACIVLASEHFSESDYIREWASFEERVR
ncbi:MAG TPA: FdtA/QdtA family cupin domain-containing protein [Polyangiaceae bacterium]|jgi:dTDP-4-dehydrorhamnose 3,5-epimerase-like enzyme